MLQQTQSDGVARASLAMETYPGVCNLRAVTTEPDGECSKTMIWSYRLSRTTVLPDQKGVGGTVDGKG